MKKQVSLFFVVFAVFSFFSVQAQDTQFGEESIHAKYTFGLEAGSQSWGINFIHRPGSFFGCKECPEPPEAPNNDDLYTHEGGWNYTPKYSPQAMDSITNARDSIFWLKWEEYLLADSLAREEGYKYNSIDISSLHEINLEIPYLMPSIGDTLNRGTEITLRIGPSWHHKPSGMVFAPVIDTRIGDPYSYVGLGITAYGLKCLSPYIRVAVGQESSIEGRANLYEARVGGSCKLRNLQFLCYYEYRTDASSVGGSLQSPHSINARASFSFGKKLPWQR